MVYRSGDVAIQACSEHACSSRGANFSHGIENLKEPHFIGQKYKYHFVIVVAHIHYSSVFHHDMSNFIVSIFELNSLLFLYCATVPVENCTIIVIV